MTDRERLLKAILDNPEEDTPRLMYADEVEEHGDPHRAEFIRVGCELARTPGLVKTGENGGGWEKNPRRAELQAREAELLSDDVRTSDWFSLPGLRLITVVNPRLAWTPDGKGEWEWDVDRREWRPDEGDPIRVEFRRGFVERVTFSGNDWARHGDAVLAAHPVRRVTLTDGSLFLSAWDVDYSRRLIRYYVAGQLVGIPAPPEGQTRNSDAAVRLALSARWPRIPPDGWAFATTRSEWSLPPGGWQVAPPFHIT